MTAKNTSVFSGYGCRIFDCLAGLRIHNVCYGICSAVRIQLDLNDENCSCNKKKVSSFLTDFVFTYFPERLSSRGCVAQVTKATSQSTTYLSRTINVQLLVRPILVRLTIGLSKKYEVMLKFDN